MPAPNRRATEKPWGGPSTHTTAWSPASMLRIAPDQNVIVGAQNICRYLGISSVATMWKWVELYGLPVIKRPDGVWMTTMTSIDQWIFLVAEISDERRTTSKGGQYSPERQIEILQNQVKHPELFSNRRRAAAIRVAKGVGMMAGRIEPNKPYTASSIEREKRSLERYGGVGSVAGLPDPTASPQRGESTKATDTREDDDADEV